MVGPSQWNDMMSLLSVSCMIELQCLTEFDDQRLTFRDNRDGSGQVLARRVQDRLLIDLVEQV